MFSQDQYDSLRLKYTADLPQQPLRLLGVVKCLSENDEIQELLA